MSNTWRQILILPIFKKVNKSNCDNYRGIALLGVTYQILASIIRNRLEKYMEEMLGEYQGGFRTGTTDQIN